MKELKKAIAEVCKEISPQWIRLSELIHANPEFNFQEFKASKWLCQEFSGIGFTIELGVGNIPTAFRASLDSGKSGPTVGVIIEYDAIEGLGHACGHNTKGPAALCGIQAFVKTVPQYCGRIVVFGCPAEEGGGGKVLMADAGVFDCADVCLEVGAGPSFGTGPRVYAMQSINCLFHGKSAHAGLKHLPSVNALHSLLYVLGNLDYLRKHLGERGLIHEVVREGGVSPAVIPDRASATINVRAANISILGQYVRHIETLANLAAEVSTVTAEIEKGLVYKDYAKCPSLTRMVMSNFEIMGFNAHCLLDKGFRGSTDVGNVSHIVPTESIYIGLGQALVPHTDGFRAAAGGEPGRRAVVNGGRMLAGCLVDLLVDDSNAFMQQVKDEFDESGDETNE